MQKVKEIEKTQITKIPDDWKLIHLNEIVEINPETIDKKYSFDDIEYIDIGSVENYQIKKYEYIKLSKRPSRAQRIVRKNDIIVSTVRPYLHGFTKIVDSKPSLICSTGFAVLKSKDLRTVDFIFNFIKSDYFESQLNMHMTGLAYPAVTSKIVGNTILASPKNMNEIEKIGTILSNVDELIQKTDQIIEQTQKLKKGLMQRLLTKGIGHTKFKKTELGEIPDEWEIAKLGEISKIERGKFSHRPRNDPAYYGGKYPFIQTGDVENSDGYIKNYSQTLNEKGISVSKLFPKDTIVITIAANIGSTAITTFPVYFPDSIVGISTSKMNIKFLEYFLRTQKKFLQSKATISAQSNINLQTLNPLLVPLPSKEEQNLISSILLGTDDLIFHNIREKILLENLKKGLMQQLLTGKIRVKL